MPRRDWILGGMLLGALALVGILWVGHGGPVVERAQAPSDSDSETALRSKASHWGSGAQPVVLPTQLQALRQRRGDAGSAAEIVAFMVETANLDPASAVRMSLELEDSEGRAEALHESLPLWLGADLAAARSWLLENIEDLPVELAQALARDAAAFEPRLGFDVARQMPHPGERRPAMRDVFSSWTAREPAEAARMAESLIKEEGRPDALAEVGRLWAEQDPRAAHAWASRLPDEASRRDAFDPLITTWAGRAPAEAARAVSALPPDPLRERLTDRVALEWAASEPKAALAWAQSIGDPRERATAATTVLTQLVHSQPSLAGSWAVPLAGGDLSSPVIEKFVSAWVAKDPPAAVHWASQEPKDKAGTLLAMALERWQKQDASAAQGWLANHPREAVEARGSTRAQDTEE